MREIVVDGQDLTAIASVVLARGGCLEFSARGCSMEPTIRDGDSILVRPLVPRRLKKGAVVLYRSGPGCLAAHRVIRNDCDCDAARRSILVRGDAPTSPDEFIALNQILGEVTRVKSGQRVRHVDRGLSRVAGFVMARSKELGLPIMDPRTLPRRIAAGALRGLHSLRAYRALARQILGSRATYETAYLADARELSSFFGYGWLPGIGDPVETMKRELALLHGLGHMLVARLRGKVAGAVTIRQLMSDVDSDSDMWLFGLRVRPAFRGAGIGAGLIRMALDRAALDRADRVNVQVGERNAPALGLFGRLGFNKTESPECDDVPNDQAVHAWPRHVVLSKYLK